MSAQKRLFDMPFESNGSHVNEDMIEALVEGPEAVIASHIQAILNIVGADMTDPNFTGTPARVARAMMQEWFVGYQTPESSVVKVFPNRGQERDLVVVKDIPFYSTCAHHLAIFFGKAAVAYIPAEHVLGLSKMARIVDLYARRLQLQERITGEVADLLMKTLKPKGVMVSLYDVQHTCMTSRGVSAHGSSTTTSAVRGVFFENPSLRAEAATIIFGR